VSPVILTTGECQQSPAYRNICYGTIKIIAVIMLQWRNACGCCHRE